MTNNNVILTRTEITSFKGISHESPVVLFFEKQYKAGKNIVTLSGDQGVRKTSTMEALMYLMAVNFEVDISDMINMNDQTIKADLEFMCGDTKYHVKANKSRFVLERYLETEDYWITESEPKSTLKKLIGNVGVSPMFLKALDGKKQIEWFRKTFAPDEEISKKEIKLKENLKKATESRREANREYQKLKASLETKDLYINWEESEKLYSEAKSADEINSNYQQLIQKQATKEAAVERLEFLKKEVVSKTSAVSDTERKIKELQEQLILQQKEVETAKEAVEKGENFLKSYSTIDEEVASAKAAWENINNFNALKREWDDIVVKKKEMDEFETFVQKLDSQKDEIKSNLLELTKKYLPDVEGLEMKVNDGIDSDEEGIFYNGKTLAQLSESELWQLFFMIWEQKDVQFVFIENVSSLGSNAIDVLNQIAEKGVKVFASQMKRNQNSIKITFADQL